MPVEPVIAKRTANALVADAEAPLIPGILGATINGVLDSFKARHGGLWVGGKALLTSTSLAFIPNAVNRAAHRTGLTDIEIPLLSIDAVSVQRMPVTSAAVIVAGQRSLSLRCFRATSFAEEVQAAVTAART